MLAHFLAQRFKLLRQLAELRLANMSAMIGLAVSLLVPDRVEFSRQLDAEGLQFLGDRRLFVDAAWNGLGRAAVALGIVRACSRQFPRGLRGRGVFFAIIGGLLRQAVLALPQRLPLEPLRAPFLKLPLELFQRAVELIERHLRATNASCVQGIKV